MNCHCACCDEPSTIGADASYPWVDLVKEWRAQRKIAAPQAREPTPNLPTTSLSENTDK